MTAGSHTSDEGFEGPGVLRMGVGPSAQETPRADHPFQDAMSLVFSALACVMFVTELCAWRTMTLRDAAHSDPEKSLAGIIGGHDPFVRRCSLQPTHDVLCFQTTVRQAFGDHSDLHLSDR